MASLSTPTDTTLVPNWVFQFPGLKAHDLMAYTVLCMHQQEGTLEVSQPVLADEAHCSLRTIRSALHRLKNLGLITWSRNPERMNPFTYELLEVAE